MLHTKNMTASFERSAARSSQERGVGFLRLRMEREVARRVVGNLVTQDAYENSDRRTRDGSFYYTTLPLPVSWDTGKSLEHKNLEFQVPGHLEQLMTTEDVQEDAVYDATKLPIIGLAIQYSREQHRLSSRQHLLPSSIALRIGLGDEGEKALREALFKKGVFETKTSGPKALNERHIYDLKLAPLVPIPVDDLRMSSAAVARLRQRGGETSAQFMLRKRLVSAQVNVMEFGAQRSVEDVLDGAQVKFARR